MSQAPSGATGPQEPLLKDAVVVELKPYTTQQVVGYIAGRFARERRGEPEVRWLPVLQCLEDEPNGALALNLSSPLRLFVAVAAYQHPDTQPAELVGLSADAINERLFRMFIPAVALQRMRPGRSSYAPDKVERWMSTLAWELCAQQERGGSGTDFDLSSLWTVAGSRTPRYVSAAIHALFVALALSTGAVLYSHSHLIATNTPSWIAFVVASAIVVAYTFRRASRPSVQVSRFDLSQLGIAGSRRRLLSGLGPGVVAGLLGGLAVGPTTGLALALAITLVGGLADTFTKVLTRRPVAIGQPSQLVTQGVVHDLVILVGYGLAGGLVAAFAGGLPFKPMAVYIGLSFGVALGAVTVAGSPWLRYFAATCILAGRDELPGRPARMMDWAYHVGILRLAGVSIQFRSRELQDVLLREHISSQQQLL